MKRSILAIVAVLVSSLCVGAYGADTDAKPTKTEQSKSSSTKKAGPRIKVGGSIKTRVNYYR